MANYSEKLNTMRLATGLTNEVRMMLVGITGSGKSSCGNTILGEDRFLADESPVGITKECSAYSREFYGRRLFVVDTPGFFDPTVYEETIQDEIGKAYELTAAPGPHVFLLVLEAKRFTAEQAQAVENFKKIFEPDPLSHTIIIFTHGDSFKPPKKPIDKYLELVPRDSILRAVLDQCEERYLLVDNTATAAEKDVLTLKLLHMIDDMIRKNDGQVYRTVQFDAVAQVIADERLKGIYNPFNQYGSFTLHPKIKEITVEGHARQKIGRQVVH